MCTGTLHLGTKMPMLSIDGLMRLGVLLICYNGITSWWNFVSIEKIVSRKIIHLVKIIFNLKTVTEINIVTADI